MENEKQDTVARLLALMDKSPGFAGLGGSIQTITRLGEDLDGGTRAITEAILRDAALTSKLLRISNSSRNARGGRNVSTIDQALMLLGVNTVKSVALSLALLGSLSHKPQSNQLHAEIVTSYFCGCLAGEITRMNAPRYSAQEAHVCGLLQNIGRMMALYYLYDDVERARALQAEQNLTEDEAIRQTLGTSFEQISVAIARQWSLPDVLQNSLAADLGKAPPRVVSTALVWQQLCAAFCRRVTDIVFRLPENREKIELSKEIEYFRLALQLKESEVRELVGRCLEDTDQVLAEMSFPCNVDQARKLLRKASERVMEMLSAGDSLTKMDNAIDGKSPVEIIQHVLRLIHDHCNFDRTLLCLPDSSSGLVAIAGVGNNANQVTARFRCFGAKPDLFRAIMARRTDTYIADVTTPAYAKLLPEWYAQLVGARAFVMLPLMSGGKLLGMLYGDFGTAPASAPGGWAQAPMAGWREILVKALAAGQTRPV
ncbi:HDOD domain-containing protein [Propionivibrio dicarboxylicus]|nr:HDOD domain-containing protein [Propionivibrio dicarboxylicus]